jgi:hypothetical protein
MYFCIFNLNILALLIMASLKTNFDLPIQSYSFGYLAFISNQMWPHLNKITKHTHIMSTRQMFALSLLSLFAG